MLTETGQVIDASGIGIETTIARRRRRRPDGPDALRASAR